MTHFSPPSIGIYESTEFDHDAACCELTGARVYIGTERDGIVNAACLRFRNSQDVMRLRVELEYVEELLRESEGNRKMHEDDAAIRAALWRVTRNEKTSLAPGPGVT